LSIAATIQQPQIRTGLYFLRKCYFPAVRML